MFVKGRSIHRMAQSVMHVKCRGKTYPIANPPVHRTPVPDDVVSWKTDFPQYNPTEFTASFVFNKPWADPEIGNPVGRTGISGRGVLGKWGPNHAADPIVTRWKRDNNGEILKDTNTGKPILEAVLIQRGDCNEWAIPGGMVDPGEDVSETLKREFGEEALNSMEASEEEKQKLEKAVDHLFHSGDDIYQGYVDDPRNTDNAWMETVARNFHDETGDSVSKIKLHAGSDAAGVQWRELNGKMEFYASHFDVLQAVVSLRKAHW